MANLQAVLEKRGVASPRDVSEAVARSQLHGGALTTSLLEVVGVDETALSAALSECYGLPAAGVGPLRLPAEGTALLLPREVATRYCCFPLESQSGELVLAVPEPLERSLREELSFALGVQLTERVAPEVRIREAISRQYGSPLSTRDELALARLEGGLEDAPREKPVELWSEAELSKLPRPPSDPPPPPPDVPEWPREPNRALPAVERRPHVIPPSQPGRARRRGPFSLNTARDELGRAASRDEVLDVFFGFACQFFEYSALFAVHSALAEGLNAWGPGSDREAVQAVGVPLDLPSSLSEAAESGSVRLARLSRDGIDRTLAVDLRRQFDAKVMILPVCLRGRCAVLLYGDNGSSDVLESEIVDVAALAPDVANALGRIILLRKRDHQARQAPLDAAELSAALTVKQPAAAIVPRPLESSMESSAESGAADFSLLTLPGKNRDKSRSNGRSSSKSDPALSSELSDNVPLQSHNLVSIEPPGTPPADLSLPEAPTKTPTPQEDPVFLLAPRTATKDRVTPLPPAPAAPYRGEVFQSGITRPARSSANQPRLPSVIVDEASQEITQWTRAGAVTHPPIAAREALIVRSSPDAMDAPTMRPALGRSGKPSPTAAASAPVAPRLSPERASPAPGSPAVEPAARPPVIVAKSAPNALTVPASSRAELSSTATTAPPPSAVVTATPPARPPAPEPRAPYPLASASSPAPPLVAPAPAAQAPAARAAVAPAPAPAPAARAAAPTAAPGARHAAAAPKAAAAKAPAPAAKAAAPAAKAAAPAAKAAAAAKAPAPAEGLPARAAPGTSSSAGSPPPAASASAGSSADDVATSDQLAADVAASNQLAADKLAAAKLAAQFPPAAPTRPLSARPGATTQPFGHRPITIPPRRSSAPPPAMPRPQSSFPPAATRPAATRSGLPKRTASAPAPSSDSLPSAKPAPRIPTARPPIGSAGRAAVPPPAPLPSDVSERPAPAARALALDAPFASSTAAEPPAAMEAPSGAAASAPSAVAASLSASPISAAAAAPASARGAPASHRNPTPGKPPAPEASVPPADPELDALVEQLCQGNAKAAQDLARIGAPTLPRLMARFPGPVVSERAGPNSRASECGPLLQALASIGSPAVPDIMRSSEDPDAGIRRWATLLLGEIPGPEACRAVVQRLADDVPRVHQAALDAARLLLGGSAANLFRKTLFEVAEAEDAQLTLRLRTLEHVARLKDSASVPRLIALLSLDTEPVVHKALWALTVITRHDFGRDVPAWTDWWQTHQSKHRFQWLIEALDHDDARLRKAAGDELQMEAKESFGYTEHLAQAERATVQQHYRQWWETTGARRYGRVQ